MHESYLTHKNESNLHKSDTFTQNVSINTCAACLTQICHMPPSNVRHGSSRDSLAGGIIRHRCVAVCCSMLQYVAVCCSGSLLQYVAGCDMTHHMTHWQVTLSDTGMLQQVAVCFSMLQYVAVCCSVLQYVAGCDMTHHMTHWQVTLSDIRKVLQPGSEYHSLVQLDIRCVAVCCSTLQCVAVCCSVCCSVLQRVFQGRSVIRW